MKMRKSIWCEDDLQLCATHGRLNVEENETVNNVSLSAV